MSYRIEYSPNAETHLRPLTARQQGTILDVVDLPLAQQPRIETRHRKPMRPNPVAPWELRIGHLRVYYDVQDTPERVVRILAVGVKVRNHVRIGNEVVEL